MPSPRLPTPPASGPSSSPPTITLHDPALDPDPALLTIGTSTTAEVPLEPDVHLAFRQLAKALGTHLPNGINRARAAGREIRRFAR